MDPSNNWWHIQSESIGYWPRPLSSSFGIGWSNWTFPNPGVFQLFVFTGSQELKVSNKPKLNVIQKLPQIKWFQSWNEFWGVVLNWHQVSTIFWWHHCWLCGLALARFAFKAGITITSLKASIAFKSSKEKKLDITNAVYGKIALLG